MIGSPKNNLPYISEARIPMALLSVSKSPTFTEGRRLYCTDKAEEKVLLKEAEVSHDLSALRTEMMFFEFLVIEIRITPHQ